MSVSFGGFNMNTATFKTTEEITAGTPVKMTESATVAPCADGEEFIGFAVNCDGKYASVQLSGAVTVPYTSTAPEVGYTDLAAAEGGVKSGAGREYLVLAVDENAATVTFLM
jgi:hypothetical protein